MTGLCSFFLCHFIATVGSGRHRNGEFKNEKLKTQRAPPFFLSFPSPPPLFLRPMSPSARQRRFFFSFFFFILLPCDCLRNDGNEKRAQAEIIEKDSNRRSFLRLALGQDQKLSGSRVLPYFPLFFPFTAFLQKMREIRIIAIFFPFSSFLSSLPETTSGDNRARAKRPMGFFFFFFFLFLSGPSLVKLACVFGEQVT